MYRYGYESLVTPPSVFDYDMEARTSALRKQKEVLGGYEPSRYRTERVQATATGILTLLGIDADPVASREHILVSRLLDAAWLEGGDGRDQQRTNVLAVVAVAVLALSLTIAPRPRFGIGFAQDYVPTAQDYLNNLWVFIAGVLVFFMQAGFAMVILSAALRGIPEETIEAAIVDGTNYAFFNDGSLVSFVTGANADQFNDNNVGTGNYNLEYDGISNSLTAFAPRMRRAVRLGNSSTRARHPAMSPMGCG